jgi:hypothetical protein
MKMIEVYTKGKKKVNIFGLIESKKFGNWKKKLMGYLDGIVAKDKNCHPLLYLKDEGKIISNEDWKREEMSYLKDEKIYSIGKDKLLFSFHKVKGEIHNNSKGKVIYLRGEGINELIDLDFFGICAIFLDLFAGEGQVMEKVMMMAVFLRILGDSPYFI